MTLSYTLHLRLAVPDFLSEPWHQEFAQAMDSIDQAIFNALIAANTSIWLNSHAYTVGQIVIDPQTGILYTVAIAHTTDPAGTFAVYLAAHPTFYSSFSLALASQAEAEAGIENTKYMSALRVAQAIAFQSPIPGIASLGQALAGTDNITMMTPLRTAQAISARLSSFPQGRMTLASGNPVMSATVATTAIIYYASSIGQSCPLYNGTTFDTVDLWDELLGSTTDTAKNPAAMGVSKVNDWFVWTEPTVVTISIAAPAVVSFASHAIQVGHPFQFTTDGSLPTGITPDTTYYVIAAGLAANTFEFSATKGGGAVNTSGSQSGTQTLTTRRFTRGPDWTNDTTRSAGTAIQRVKGIYLNSIALTNGPAALRGTWVGTTRSNASSQLEWTYGVAGAPGTAGFFSLWNTYNRKRFSTTVADTTATWTYGTATWRSAQSNASMRVTFVRGLNEDAISATYIIQALNSASGGACAGIGLDTTATPIGIYGYAAPTLSAGGLANATYEGFGLLGAHFVQAIEASADGSVVTYFSHPSAFIQMGMKVSIEA
jgi:hypothetical protein